MTRTCQRPWRLCGGDLWILKHQQLPSACIVMTRTFCPRFFCRGPRVQCFLYFHFQGIHIAPSDRSRVPLFYACRGALWGRIGTGLHALRAARVWAYFSRGQRSRPELLLRGQLLQAGMTYIPLRWTANISNIANPGLRTISTHSKVLSTSFLF